MPPPRPLWLLLIAAAILGGAYAFQYVGGLQPCELCLLQRHPWRVVIALSALGVLRPAWARWLAPACGLVLAAGAALALYHVGVEYHWWRGPDACTGALGQITSAEALIEQLSHTNVVRCDQPAWVLFGISMAGYNALVSAALAAWIFWPRRKAA